MIQLKITSLIRFTQGHEVSVADFYLTLGKSKNFWPIKRRVYLGFLGINIGREFSYLFLTSSTSPNSHRFDVHKSFIGSQDFHRKIKPQNPKTLNRTPTKEWTWKAGTILCGATWTAPIVLPLPGTPTKKKRDALYYLVNRTLNTMLTSVTTKFAINCVNTNYYI